MVGGSKVADIVVREEDAQVGMLPMVATPERREVMAGYFALTLRESDRIAPLKVRAFAAVAISLGLHPLAGELMIIEGRLYITIDGRRRLAMRQPDFAAIQPFIVTDEPTRVAMGATRKGDVLAGCRLYRKSTPIETIQYGLVREAERWPSKDKVYDNRRVPGEQTKLGLTDDQVDAAKSMHDPDSLFDLAGDPAAKVRPVLTQPAMMAMKRAEARALSVMASVALPTYDADTGAVLDPDTLPNGDAIEGSLVEPETPAPAPEPTKTVRPVAEPSPYAGLAEPETPTQDFEPAEAAVESEVVDEGGNGPIAEPEPDAMARDIPPAPAPGRRPARATATASPVGGGLVRPPETPDAVIRFAIEKLHYRNIAAVLAALNVTAAEQIDDCPRAWEQLVKLAPA
jgi:hypothetical protein